jgi:Rps23 Pro-64 3,4-dihydroxylase Tpa1-like proline 4-hydroxylase
MAKEERAVDIEGTFTAKTNFLLQIKTQTVELYMNGQTHSQCGKMHSDEKEDWDPNSDYITLVYYANKEWYPEWGGFTVVDDGQNTHIIYPKPNSVVVFNSRFRHVALEPTVHCPSMRITLAHKMKIIKE